MPDSSVRNASDGVAAAQVSIIAAHRFTVFGSGGFAGNPTTIHEIAAFPADSVLLAHSQTLATIDNGYVLQTAQPGAFRAKFFSHQAPLTICGHALLAAGHHLLATTGLLALTITTPAFSHQCKRSGAAGTLLSLPRHPGHVIRDSALVDRLVEATRLQQSEVDTALLFPFNVYVLITPSLAVLQDFKLAGFEWQGLADLQPGALILSCALADGAYAFRYFSPWWGKPEDSATGSAHSYLAPYWLQPEQRVQTLQWSPQGPASAQVLLTVDRVWIGGHVASAS